MGDSTKNYNVDAIEVLNGTSAPYINRKAEELAKSLNLPGVGGSDAHHVSELWTVYTEIQASLDISEILKAIKNGHVRAAPLGKSIHF
jgi:predicted metal-dependent phosphoesterase TrpH